MQRVHPAITCLVDGDAAGRSYIAALSNLPSPPRSIICWPNGWAIEQIVSWIISADVGVLSDGELAAAGVPRTLPEFLNAISSPPLKTNEVVHGLIADVISRSPSCIRRVLHLLGTFGSYHRQPDPTSWGGRLHPIRRRTNDNLDC